MQNTDELLLRECECGALPCQVLHKTGLLSLGLHVVGPGAESGEWLIIISKSSYVAELKIRRQARVTIALDSQMRRIASVDVQLEIWTSPSCHTAITQSRTF